MLTFVVTFVICRVRPSSSFIRVDLNTGLIFNPAVVFPGRRYSDRLLFFVKKRLTVLWQLCILDWILRKQLLTNQQSRDSPGRPGSKILPKLRQNNGLINFGNTLIKSWCWVINLIIPPIPWCHYPLASCHCQTVTPQLSKASDGINLRFGLWRRQKRHCCFEFYLLRKGSELWCDQVIMTQKNEWEPTSLSGSMM